MSKKPSLPRKLLLLLPAAMLLGALSTPSAGCGDPCVSICEDAKSCDRLGDYGFVDDMGNPVTDCAAYCEDQSTYADELGCGSEFDDFMGCFASFDICADFETEEPSEKDIEKALECNMKTQAMLDCIQAAVAP